MLIVPQVELRQALFETPSDSEDEQDGTEEDLDQSRQLTATGRRLCR